MATSISVELRNYFDSQTYKEALDNAAGFSKRLQEDRKTRVPFFDNQTGLNQQDCYIWRSPVERKRGVLLGQVYTYPSRRWRITNAPHPKRQPRKVVPDAKLPAPQQVLAAPTAEPAPVTAARRTPRTADSTRKGEARTGNRYRIDDSDSEEEPAPTPPLDEDDDSDDDIPVKRKSRKARTTNHPTPPRPRREQTITDTSEYPYLCEECSRRYKTAPAMKAHMTKYHSANSNHQPPAPRGTPTATPRPTPVVVTVAAPPIINTPPPAPPPVVSGPVASEPLTSPRSVERPTRSSRRSSNSSSLSNDDLVLQRRTRNKKTPVRFCGFCLGDENANKNTGKPEKMVACSKCARCAHPSCLKFSPALAAIIMTYQWECNECKSCAICHKSDHEPEILFCDDCDRGYHMFCVTPPIKEPPEGSWSCDVCLYRLGKK